MWQIFTILVFLFSLRVRSTGCESKVIHAGDLGATDYNQDIEIKHGDITAE